MKKIFNLVLTSVLFCLMALPLQAAEPYDLQKFQEAQKNGERIVLQFQADWCPVCQKQKPNLEALQSELDKNKIRLMTVIFDKEKQLVQKMNVPSPSTLVAFIGNTEVKKMPNQVTKEQLTDFMNTAFGGKK